MAKARHQRRNVNPNQTLHLSGVQKTKKGRDTASKMAIKDIHCAARKHCSAEEKIHIVLHGSRGEETIAELFRREGIAQSICNNWYKESPGSSRTPACRRYGPVQHPAPPAAPLLIIAVPNPCGVWKKNRPNSTLRFQTAQSPYR